MESAMPLGVEMGGSRSSSIPCICSAMRRIRSVGSFVWLDSSASIGQWPNCSIRRVTWECAVSPLSEDLFMVLVRCSKPICIIGALMGGRPSPYSLRGR